MASDGFLPQALSSSMRSLAGGVPPAPLGTIFVLGTDGGFAVPPREFTMYFGRSADDVHIPVGVCDERVSRRHGAFEYDGQQWRISNLGQLPIEFPGEALLLNGQQRAIEPGYTPMFIGSRKGRSHLLEVHVVRAHTENSTERQHSRTVPPKAYPLSTDEKLVLTALAQRYLRQERFPQPLSWRQVAEELNSRPDERMWSPRTASYIVEVVRNRLAIGPDPIDGIRTEDGIGEPVGNTLSHNLIQALLRSATLAAADLRMLDNTLDDDSAELV
ncbi:FHA domain-containing protein [Nocardia sp. NPDC059177]|uniref:FHA domain-containing protein n=1 Tax=Nocardia sp. NPDC059177 TaxID=3346759 RepID=UPI0036CA5C78